MGPRVPDTSLLVPARVCVSSVSASDYPFGSAWTDTSVLETSATGIPFKIQSPEAACPVSRLREPPGEVGAGALGSPGEAGPGVTQGGPTFCRNFQRMGKVSLPFRCSTRCRRCSTVTLRRQLHILELCSTLLRGRRGRKAAGSPKTILATGLELIRSSRLTRVFTARRFLSRCWVERTVLGSECEVRCQHVGTLGDPPGGRRGSLPGSF